MASEKGTGEPLDIDSAGTGSWMTGEPVDPRMQAHTALRGYHPVHTARQFDPSVDFDRFDLIIGMDDSIVSRLESLARHERDRGKITRMTRYSRHWGYTFIPDPYPGGEEGFELVLDLLEDACGGLLEELLQHKVS